MKLPDMSRRCLSLGFALVSIAHKSLTTANANSEASNGRFQLAEPAATTASPAAATNDAAITAFATRPGSGIVRAAPTTLVIGQKRAHLKRACVAALRSAIAVAHVDSFRSERRPPRTLSFGSPADSAPSGFD